MRFGHWLQIGLFLAFLCAGTVSSLYAFGLGHAVSETENRALASLPRWSVGELKSGTYFRQLENYWADHVAFRDSLVSAGQKVASWRGLSGGEHAVLIASQANNTGGANAVPAQEQTASAASIEAAPRTTVPEAPRAVEGPSQEASASKEKGRVIGKVLVVGNKAVNLFTSDPAAGQAYADAVNRFRDEFSLALGGEATTFVLLAPTAAEWVSAASLKSLSDSQRQTIEDVYKRLHPQVKTIDAWSSLNAHKQETLYFRTDHHWTATGAYYAYEAFMNAQGVPPVPLARYETENVTGFLGSLYSATLSSQLQKAPDTLVLYKPFVKHEYAVHYAAPLRMELLDKSHAAKKNKYRIFLSGDRPWGLIKTEAESGRRVAVVKDSYGNALIPFLLPHYKEIYVIDPRQFDQPLVPFLKKRQIRELLFLNNTEVAMYDGFSQQIGKLLTTSKAAAK
ncbi:DHHW family protein [Paenibacillus elgii]|uniref:AlgX/AlgJ SGNH hydrolase-like domain-containing protein n=1 Tax=Paenibacillus elgii TaxID=189691 RepID=A0A161S9I3_9BACL|nr:DHHW family protein [Paenibacillus elgii]KZE82069.1 hypothetical protein AV654_09375 [Paenibacillus elgii]NEN81906.1 hypothetical protein [Paenibacillus elgii]